MTDKLKQKIKEELVKLSKEKQEAINAVSWTTISEDIGKKFLLSESEINDLQVQILLILISLTSLNNFAQNVENEIGTSKEEAKKIADEVIQKVFIPITNIGTEKIKKNVMGKDTDWQQNLDFILSGGDYSSFVVSLKVIEPEKDEKKKVPVVPETPTVKRTPVISVPPFSTTPTLADIKANTEKTDIPMKPKETVDSKINSIKI